MYCGAMENADGYVARWREAGLIDEPTAAAIRKWELERVDRSDRGWLVRIALILGGLLLGAGVLLFVAAHWDAVSPPGRMLLVLAMLAFFHSVGLLVQERFDELATAMHAVGTVAAGAAIALLGQIFHMQEHWASAVLLWALCAAAGWVLLRDEFQQTLTLLLVPAWMVCEWGERAEGYNGEAAYVGRLLMVIGAVYLVAFLRSKRRAISGILFGVGAALLLVGVPLVVEGWIGSGMGRSPFAPGGLRATALLLMVLAAAAGWRLERRSLEPVLIVAGLSIVLPWSLTKIVNGSGAYQWTYAEPGVLTYLLVAAAAVYLVWWGVRIAKKGVVNFGMVAFAITLFWFYMSSLMDKLGRSLGLMLLGVLFLGGGWALERTRRVLIGGMAGGVA